MRRVPISGGCAIKSETAMHWMIRPLRRYADFHGRSRRLELWLFVLFLFLAFTAAVWLDTVLGTGGEAVTDTTSGPGIWSGAVGGRGGWITLVPAVAMLVPMVAVMVRRLHDVGWRGLWLLAAIVPLVGGLFLLVLFLTDGQHGDNRFGDDPRQVAA